MAIGVCATVFIIGTFVTETRDPTDPTKPPEPDSHGSAGPERREGADGTWQCAGLCGVPR